MTRPCTVRARWTGPAPRRGQWFRSRRGRTAYEIAAVAPLSGANRFKLTVVRHPLTEIPQGATVYLWQWDKRAKRRAA